MILSLFLLGNWWATRANGSILFGVIYAKSPHFPRNQHRDHFNPPRSHAVRPSPFLTDLRRRFSSDTTMIQSSDSEPEHLPSPSISHHFTVRSATPPPAKSLHPNRMIVQRSVDEERMNIVRERMDARPSDSSSTQPLPRKTRDYASVEQMNSPSSETPVKSGPVAKRIQALKALHNEYAKKRMNTFDFDRVPSESSTHLAVSTKKSNRGRLKAHRQYHSASRKCQRPASVTRRQRRELIECL